MHRHVCDVLVVGGGGAALRAAIEAHERLGGHGVLLVTKGELGKSGCTALSCSDRMAFHATLPYTAPGGPDNWRFHADDIYRIGGFVSDGNLAEVLARSSGEAFQYLDGLGVPWVKKEGRADQFVTDGSKYARACYTGPYTANHIEEALVRRARQIGLKVMENQMIVDLVMGVDGERVGGAIGLEETRSKKPELHIFQAKAVVLATGGAGGVYRVNVFPPGMTGDGYAMAYRKGAELVNMEFIQIGLSSVATNLACSGSMMRSIPRMINDKGEEFLHRYFPQGTTRMEMCHVVFDKGASWPVSSEERSSLIDVAVSKEMLRGQKVYLDYSENPEGFDFSALREGYLDRYTREIKSEVSEEERAAKPVNRLSDINPPAIGWLRERGIDLMKGDRVEIAPAVQHFQGGVKIGARAQTSIAGLFACGEVAGGQHGANRPGGNALMDSQVFGKMAGRCAAEEAAAMGGPPSMDEDEVAAICARIEGMGSANGVGAAEARRLTQEMMASAATVIRTEQGLTRGLAGLKELREAGIQADEEGIAFALETMNLFDVAETVMSACLMRKEKRGPHLFFAGAEDDLPLERDDANWCRYIVIRRRDGEPGLTLREPARRGEVGFRI